jgi:hypothetical protein
VGKHVKYLYLNFDGESNSEDLAKLYVDAFRKFESIETLRIETYDDGNLTNIVKEMMKDENFPWFGKVRIIKCYLIRDLKDKSML